MRQKCDYCGSNPEVPVSGNCPNCGARFPIIPNFYVERGTYPPIEDMDIAGSCPRPSGTPLRDIWILGE